jgi:hypothetical protein
MFAPAAFVCVPPQVNGPEPVIGLKPPANQPHVTPAAFMMLPMFGPLSVAVVPVEQSSKAG